MAKRKRKPAKKSFRKFSLGYSFIRVGGFLLRHVGGIILIVVLLGGFVWFKQYCYTNPTFIIQDIEINRTRFISREDILQVGRLRTGVNIFTLDIQDSAARLERFPRIKRAEITRVLPHTIRVNITERIAVAQIKLPFRDKYYLIDAEGCVLVPVLQTPHADLVTIEARFSTQSYLTPGEYFFNPYIDQALKVINRLQYHPVMKNEVVSAIIVDHAGDMTVVLGDKLEIKIGTEIDDALKKLDNISDILEDPNRASIRYIDVRFKDIAVKSK